MATPPWYDLFPADPASTAFSADAPTTVRDAPSPTPSAPPVLPSSESGPGFFGTLGQILAGLKIGVYKGRPGSSTLPGLSYNDLVAPLRDAKERRQLFDTYLNLGEQSGMDMAPFKKIAFDFMGPSPSLIKTMGDMYKEHLQWGSRVPMGEAAATRMFPPTVIPGMPGTPVTPGIPGPGPDYAGPGVEAGWEAPATSPPMLPAVRPPLEPGTLATPDNALLPAPGLPYAPAGAGTLGTPETVMPLTPMQSFYKDLVAKNSPRYVAEYVLPKLLQYAPELLTGTGGAPDVEKDRILSGLKAENPHLPAGFWAPYNAMPSYMWHGQQVATTLQHIATDIRAQNNATALQNYRTTNQTNTQTQRDTVNARVDEQWHARADQQERALQARIVGMDKSVAARAQQQLNALTRLRLQRRAIVEGKQVVTEQMALKTRDPLSGSQSDFRMPMETYGVYRTQAEAYVRQFPKTKEAPRATIDAIQALGAAQTTVPGRAVVEKLLQDMTGDATAKLNPQQGQQALQGRIAPPVFADVPPHAYKSLQDLDDELARLQGQIVPPPTLAPSAPPRPAGPGASHTRPPLGEEATQAALIQAYRQLGMNAMPNDAADQQQVFGAVSTILQQQGYSVQEIQAVLGN